MMGKQFSFFLGVADQAPFEEVLRKSGDVAFVELWPKEPKAQELPTSVVSRMGNEILDILIARRADLHRISFLPIRGRPEFSCDQFSAPVVEFSRCYVTKRFIRAGRLYRIDRYWDENDVRVSKLPEFTQWADRLYRLAKKSLTKIDSGYYAGAEAMELRNSGVAFEGLDIRIRSIKD